MPRPHTKRRETAPAIVAAVVQPVARRLSRIEALLLEMRFEQDLHIKRVNALKEQLDALIERRVSHRPSGNAGLAPSPQEPAPRLQRGASV